MAVTLTKVVATPYAIRYTCDASEGGTATKTRTQLLADLVAGPLKARLTQLADWSNLGITDPSVSIGLISGPNGLIAANSLLVAFGPTEMNFDAGGACNGAIELRFNHSMVR